jgi:hypothetical protein
LTADTSGGAGGRTILPVSRCGMEGTSMKENFLMREIEDHPAVCVLSERSGGIKQVTVPTSGVTVSRWGPSACRANVPRCKTAYVNLDD